MSEMDPLAEGLAIRLMGRNVLVYERHAIMTSSALTSTAVAHSVFTPRAISGAVFLWDL
ncbi:MAG: hypothetical protein JWO81_2153 [Alphaproteobacteria bacterium]|nr:hypothetical protein [Alphaproteobacteria bacterium]